MRNVRLIVAAVLAGMLIAAARSPERTDPSARPKVTNLLLTSLAEDFTPGRQVLVDMVEIPPNTALDRHWHPGEEFHYYLEGDAEIHMDGEPTIIGTPGTVGHVPFKKWHQAVAGKKGARILVFRVHSQGEPWRYLEGEAPAGPAGRDSTASR